MVVNYNVPKVPIKGSDWYRIHVHNRLIRYKFRHGSGRNKTYRFWMVVKQGRRKVAKEIPLCFGEPAGVLVVGFGQNWLQTAVVEADTETILRDHIVGIPLGWYANDLYYESQSPKRRRDLRERKLEEAYGGNEVFYSMKNVVVMEPTIGDDGDLIKYELYEFLISPDAGEVSLARGILSLRGITTEAEYLG